MSFPSAISNLQLLGVTPETATEEQARDALFAAMQSDTPDGLAFVRALAEAFWAKPEDPVAYVRDLIKCNTCKTKVLRAAWLASGALKIDVDPDSKLGRQVARLLGTDAARSILDEKFGTSFALANCCGGVAGGDKKQTTFSAAEQIAWQMTIDC